MDKDEKVLGLLRNTKTDELGFKVNIAKISTDILNFRKKPTKRQFSSIIMSIYDPLGILMPYIAQSRRLMQDVWISGVKSDEEIRDEEFIE